MTYSFDDIILKTYEKIQLTGNLSLLTDEKKTENELKAIWQTIIEEVKKITNKKGLSLELNRVSELKSYECKKSSIILAIAYLRQKYNKRLMGILTGFGFKVSKENLQEDLSIVELGISDIDILINDTSKKINKSSEVNEIRTDDIIAYHSKFFGGYIDSNKITLSQYLANNKVILEHSKKK